MCWILPYFREQGRRNRAVSFDELRQAATAVCSELHIVGCDVNELSPHYDISGVSTAVACKLVREMLLALKRNAERGK